MAVENMWNYDEYIKALKTGGDLNEQARRLATQNPDLASRASVLFNEISAQQQAGSDKFWAKGSTASTQAAAADFALRLAENGIGSLKDLGQITIPGTEELPEQQVTINKNTGQPLPRAELLGRGQRGLDIDYNLSFAANGTVIPFTSNRQSSWTQFREDTLKPVAAFALNFVGAPLVGAAVAPGLAAATQGAIGGALTGAAGAALTDSNLLQGALLGGVGGYFQGAAAAPAGDSIYSLATGTPNLDYMGGGQGLLSTGSANLASMGGGQGLQLLAGLPSTTLADALDTFGGVNAAVLPGMGAGTGITLNTPTGLVTQGGTILGNNIVSEGGLNTGFDLTDFLNTNVGTGLGTTLAGVETGINNGLFTGTTTGTVTDTDVTTPTTTVTGDSTLGTTLGGLTASQIADLLKAGVSLAALSGAANSIGGSGNNTPMQTPIQGAPTNNPNYYNQLQQYYNSYLPQTPRDVVSPLQQWYEGSFGNTGTRTVAPQQAQTAMPSAPTGTAMPPATPMPVAPMPVTSSPVPVAASTGLLSAPMTAQQQVQNLLSNPNLSNLPPEAASAISRAVSSPRSFNDVVAGGGVNKVDVSFLSPEIQRAYDIYQQSMILGTNRDVAESVYKRAGVDPTNPDAFFSNLGLLAGTPTRTALAQYAPVALDRFANTGGGALTFTVDPNTIPADYVKPNIPMSNFNMGLFTSSIMNSDKIPASMKQNYITETAQKYGFNPADFI